MKEVSIVGLLDLAKRVFQLHAASAGGGLDVWSRHLMVRIELKPSRLCCPDFADVFVGR